MTSPLGSRWVNGFFLLAVVTGVPVLAPFPGIAVHVEQRPSIRKFLADAMSVLLAVFVSIRVVPRVIGQLLTIVSEAVSRGRSCTAGVFPFGFRR